MTQNVGGKDKLFRIVIGAAIFIYGIVTNSWIGVIGLIPLGTGLMGWCPLYKPFGINTKCSVEKCEDEKKED